MENMNKTKAHNTIVAIMNSKCSGSLRKRGLVLLRLLLSTFPDRSYYTSSQPSGYHKEKLGALFKQLLRAV